MVLSVMNLVEYLYIEGEWVNSVLSAFDRLGLNVNKITEHIDEIENNRLKPEQRLEVSKLRALWHQADRLANDPLLGVKVGTSHTPRAFGVLAPVMWHSPNIRELIDNIQKFQILVSESGVFQPSIKEIEGLQFLCCEYDVAASSVPVNKHQVLSILASVVTNVRALTGGMVEVAMLSISSNLNSALIAKALNVAVISEANTFAVYFRLSDLDMCFHGVDNKLYQLNVAYAEELLRQKRSSIDFFNAIKALIKSGGYSTVKIEFVEAELGINRRAIQRQLAKRGTSFKQLKEALLKETAATELLSGSMPIDSLSSYLGYSEPSAFYRAFKSWYKMTPKAFCHIRRF